MIQCPLVSALAGTLIVAFPVITAESVTRIVIDVAGDVRVRFFDLCNLVQRNPAIFVTKVEDHRNLRRVVALGMDATAIERRCGGKAIAFASSKPADIATKTISNDTDFADTGNIIDSGLNVVLDAIIVEAAARVTALTKVFLTIAKFKTFFFAVKQGWCDGDVAVLGKFVDKVLDVLVYAKDFLNDDNATLSSS